jgi:hypothetical protein
MMGLHPPMFKKRIAGKTMLKPKELKKKLDHKQCE